MRKYPKLESSGDNGDGLHCDPNGLQPIEGDFRHGEVDSSLGY